MSETKAIYAMKIIILIMPSMSARKLVSAPDARLLKKSVIFDGRKKNKAKASRTPRTDATPVITLMTFLLRCSESHLSSFDWFSSLFSISSKPLFSADSIRHL